MSFAQVRGLVTFTAVLIWLAVLIGRQFGVSRSVYSAAMLVTAMLLAASLCAQVSEWAWGRVRHAARQNAARRATAAQQSTTGGTKGSLAWHAMAATGAVGCAAMLVSGDLASPKLRSTFSAAGRSGRRGHVIGPDTRFEIGSLTKIFTGLLLADMTIRNEIDLETPLGALIGVPAADAMTLRSLATHTSGLPRRITGPRRLPCSWPITTHTAAPILIASSLPWPAGGPRWRAHSTTQTSVISCLPPRWPRLRAPPGRICCSSAYAGHSA
jgi:CubicO group peptidase (beta-lactamase class C family)